MVLLVHEPPLAGGAASGCIVPILWDSATPRRSVCAPPKKSGEGPYSTLPRIVSG